jgi:hypothetical protein
MESVTCINLRGIAKVLNAKFWRSDNAVRSRKYAMNAMVRQRRINCIWDLVKPKENPVLWYVSTYFYWD